MNSQKKQIEGIFKYPKYSHMGVSDKSLVRGFILEINKQGDVKIFRKQLESIIEKTIKLSNVEFFGTLDVSLAFVSQKEIRKINRIYRKKDEVTDILSFSDFMGEGKKVSGRDRISCELIICHPYLEKKHKNSETSIQEETAYIISHGVLHCLGLKHSEKMYRIQEKVCEQI
ncbi:MAG: rRNA maturation RNase YbeY [bacterium]|nr:rRNA maturation RNase YbeY [bacterium]